MSLTDGTPKKRAGADLCGGIQLTSAFSHTGRLETSSCSVSILRATRQTSTRRVASINSAAWFRRSIVAEVGLEVSLMSTAQRSVQENEVLPDDAAVDARPTTRPHRPSV